MMRVLHTMGRMVGQGTERQLAGMLRAVVDNDLWKPTLCVFRSGYPLSKELAEQGVEVVELDASAARPARLFLRLRSLMASHFDVVHSSLWGANAVTRAVAATTHRPAVVISERRVEEFRSGAQRRLDVALRPLTDSYIGNSEDVGRFIERVHGVDADRVAVIRNGIDGSVFFPTERPAPKGPLRISSIGRLVQQKGFDVLLDAVEICARDMDIEVRIAGRGPLLPELAARAEGLPVVFQGYLDGPQDVAQFLHETDLFVLASRYEGFPNVVLEAMACGVPVVASDVAGTREAVTGSDAQLVPPDDPHALARAIQAAAKTNHAKPMGQIVSSFEEVARAHRDSFERAIAKHAAHV